MDITIAGPGKNALGTPVLTSLRDQLAAAGSAPLLVMGDSDAFSAGLDLKEVVASDADQLLAFLELLQEVAIGLLRHPAPTVACVNGHAIAGGAVLARACDYAVATSNPKVKIGLNETAIGLQFPPRLLDAMQHRLPRRHHAEVLLAGPLLDPRGALRVGLIDAIAEDPEADARARYDLLAALPAQAYAGNKARLLGATGLPHPEVEARVVREVLPSWTSPELKARIAKLLAR